MSLNHDLFAVQHVSSIDAEYYSSIMPKKEGKDSLQVGYQTAPVMLSGACRLCHDQYGVHANGLCFERC